MYATRGSIGKNILLKYAVLKNVILTTHAIKFSTDILDRKRQCYIKIEDQRSYRFLLRTNIAQTYLAHLYGMVSESSAFHRP